MLRGKELGKAVLDHVTAHPRELYMELYESTEDESEECRRCLGGWAIWLAAKSGGEHPEHMAAAVAWCRRQIGEDMPDSNHPYGSVAARLLTEDPLVQGELLDVFYIFDPVKAKERFRAVLGLA
jgi:hypothetical protein